MKKTILLITLISFFMVSCGGSIESDVAKLVDLQCQAMGLQKKAMSGDADAMKEVKALGEQMMTMGKELEKKYTSDEDKEKFKAAIEEAIKNQDCGK